MPSPPTRPPLLLLVLDGWGTRADVEHNAIRACAPNFHELLERYPNTLLDACGPEVGLPSGVMGNSEVGHMNLGAGRVVYQDISRIDRSITDGTFFTNAALVELIDRTREAGRTLHLLGLVSDGAVHASDQHLAQLLELCARRQMPAERVLVHAVMDGRDTPPRSGREHIARLEHAISAAGVGRIASVVGRYWAMDRDKRWERVERAYRLLVSGEGGHAASAGEALDRSYQSDVGDEFIEPTLIGEPGSGRFEHGDGVFCFNYRSDRMRQICEALAFDSFGAFERPDRPSLSIATMSQYRADFPFPLAYPPVDLSDMFPDLVSAAGLRQKRIAETEKYAHVTFFFNGGREDTLPGEERILLPSPKVATYDLQPEMSAEEVTRAILRELEQGETDVYIVNFANADMVGHTGIYEAACAAVAKVDECVGRIVAAARARGGAVVVTADHGNSEMLWDAANDQPHTAHTLNPVPIVFCSDELLGARLRERGVLADVALSLLDILELAPSAEMNGRSLFTG